MKKRLTHSEAGSIGAMIAKPIQKKLKKERIDEYNINPNLCEECRKPIGYEKRRNKFCSQSCAASYSNKNRGKVRLCLNCYKPLDSGQKKFCSKNCQSNIHWKVVFETIEAGNILTLGKSDSYLRRIAKTYLVHQVGTVCSICKTTRWMDKEIPLVIDHVDGNATNWDLKNLRLVCGNCNMLLPTFAGRNKGNGKRVRK